MSAYPQPPIQLSEPQQQEVWEGMIGAETRALYFADLGAYYLKRQRWMTWATLFLASGATAALAADWLPRTFSWVKAVLTALVAALSLLSLVEQNQARYATCSDLYFRWEHPASSYPSLWNDMYSSEAPEELIGLTEKGQIFQRAAWHWVTMKSACANGSSMSSGCGD